MARKRRKNSISLERTEDPGKDLYAYLYLMTMVFSFMLLIASTKPQNPVSGQTAPEQNDASGRSTLASVSFEKIGRLARKDNQLFLVFGKEPYHPKKDLNRLEQDGRIAVVQDSHGGKKKFIYIEEDRSNSVLLSEYLSAFQYLSRQGIGVAFAKRIK